MLSDDYVISRADRERSNLDDDSVNYIKGRLKERSEYKKNLDYEAADEIRDELRDNYGVSIDDRTREWTVKVNEYSVVGEPSRVQRFRTPLSDDISVDADDDDLEYDVDDSDDDDDDFDEFEEDDELPDGISLDDDDDFEEDDDNFDEDDDDEGTPEAEDSHEQSKADIGNSDDDLASLTVAELKDRLREAGLPVSGKKVELIERLMLSK